MLTLKQIIQGQLAKRLKEITAPLRDADEKKNGKKDRYTREEVAKIYLAARQLWDESACKKIMDLLAMVMDSPELKSYGKFKQCVGCVVVLQEADGNQHNYPINTPLISSQENMMYLFDGAIASWTATTKSNPRYATDDEIDACVNALSDKDLNSLMNYEVMRLTLIKPILDDQVSVDRQIKNPATERDLSDVEPE